MALPTYVEKSPMVGLTTGPTVALPTGWQEGDILFIFVEHPNEADISVPSGGWARVADAPQGTGTAGGTTSTKLDVFWKRATSSESSVAIADSGNHTIAIMIAIRGAIESGDPWDVTSGGVKTPASTSISITGDTTTVNDCLVIVAASHNIDSTSAQFSSIANSDLANLSTRIDEGNQAGNGGGILVVTGEKATAGAYGATTATVGSSVNGFMTIAVKPSAAPAIALNTTDGLETTDTTPTIEFTGTDPQAESIVYEVQVNSTHAEALQDSYGTANINAGGFLYSAFTAQAQSFTPTTTGHLSKVKFALQKVLSPTGNMTAKIYTHTGTYGTSSLPTGTALAESNTIDVTTVATGSYSFYEFTFPSEDNVYLLAGTRYIVAVEYSGGDASNHILVGLDTSSPTHAGNRASRTGAGVWSTSGNDVAFEVYSNTQTNVSFVSDTDSGFANTVTGGDTSPFNSGEKVSYTFQSALALGKYTYRVRGKDPSGSNAFGAWSTTRSFAIFTSTRELSTTVRSSAPSTNNGHLVTDASAYVADQDAYDSLDTSNNTYLVANGDKPYIYQKVKFAGGGVNLKVDFEAQETIAGQVGGTPTDEVAADGTTGTVWTNPSNAFVDDDVYSVTVGTTAQRFEFPAFNIPANATLTAIRIRTKGHADVANGSTIGWTIGIGGSSWGVQNTTHNTGADTESTTSGHALFNSTLTPADFNSGDVWAEGAAGSGTNTLSIDQVVFRVTYTVPSQAIVMDIWDDESNVWENLYFKDDHAASTDVATQVTKSTNLTKYYDASFWVTVRAYLDHANATLSVDRFTVIQDNSTTNTQNNSVKANILKTTTQNNSVKADILKRDNIADNSVKAAIFITLTQNVSAKANILAVTAKDNSSKANILATGQQPNDVKGNILRVGETKDSSVKASIVVTETRDNSVKAFINKTFSSDNSVKAFISRYNTTQSNSAKPNIITTYYTGATYDWKLSTADDDNKNRGYVGDE